MSKPSPYSLSKQAERAAYLFLLLSLTTGRITATLLTIFSFLIPKKKGKQKDFLFFPYAHKDNTGTKSRFQIYLPYFEKDGYTYDIDYICTFEYFNDIFFVQPNRVKEYLFYHRTFWRRLFWVLSARNYKAVFIHRALFPEYYDQFFPYLERLLRQLNKNITIDYFDADYSRNKKLVDRTVSYCDKVCVVNEHLYNYFISIHPRVFYDNLAVDTTPYIPKKNFDLKNPIVVFWTGSKANARNLKTIIPILEKINMEFPLTLTMICKSKAGYESSLIRQYPWDEKTFFKYLNESDIAIYPALNDNEINRGKVAYKVLDYVASKIPVVASPLGLSQYFKDKKDVLVANNEMEWEEAIRILIINEKLRRELAESAYVELLQHHSVDSTYKSFLKILLS